MTDADLQRIERSTFRSVADSGLWDIVLASLVAMFAIAPLLSGRLGDFWSAAVFLPFFAILLLGIRVVQARVIQPRIGIVEFSRQRLRRLTVLSVVMLVVNIVFFAVGIVAVARAPSLQGPIVPLTMSLMVLVGFSLAAFFLEIPRVFGYGLLLSLAPPIGEILFRRGYASHHGFPIVFGVCATVILVSGVVRFVRFLPPPLHVNGQPVREGADE